MRQKSTNQKCKYKKAEHDTFKYKQAGLKMLVKLTPIVITLFINLREQHLIWFQVLLIETKRTYSEYDTSLIANDNLIFSNLLIAII
jgi:hypothetical protein